MGRTRSKRFSSAALFVALGAACLPGCHHTDTPVYPLLPGTAHPAYTITDLGPGEPLGINNKGQIVGSFDATESSRLNSFLWNNGKRNELKSLNGWDASADTITDQGVIQGMAFQPSKNRKAPSVRHRCVWQNGTLTDLEADPRFRETGLQHLTKSGALFAVSKPQGDLEQQHLWFYANGFNAGPKRDLGIIGGEDVRACAVNDAGTIIGNKGVGSNPNTRHAFVWRQGKTTDLGTLGGRNSDATAINSAGLIIGVSDTNKSVRNNQVITHAFLWNHGSIHDLGTLSNGERSGACAINSAGEVAGCFEGHPPPTKPYGPLEPALWKQGHIIALNRLIPAGTAWSYLGTAWDMNDRGQIIGSGYLTGDNLEHGYLLTPIGYKAGKGDTP